MGAKGIELLDNESNGSFVCKTMHGSVVERRLP